MNRPSSPLLSVRALLPLLAAASVSVALAAPPARSAARAASASKSASQTTAAQPKNAASSVVPAASASQAAPAAAQVAEQTADYIVAVVNSEPITNHEVRARVARMRHDLQRQNAAVPPDEELRHDALEHLITERVELQQAREDGIKADDQALQQAELAIAHQNQIETVQELENLVQSEEGIPLQDFRNDVRRQVVLARLREREIDPTVKVSDAEVEAFVHEQATQASGGTASSTPQINMAMILVAVPEQASDEQVARLQQRAQEVVRRAKAGEDFAALAREYSDAVGKGQDGGVLGLRPSDRYPELFVQAMAQANIGDVAGPVRSAAGFHVLKLLDRKQADDVPDMAVPQTRVSQILLKITPKQTEQMARERLVDFKHRIAAGQATFEALAKQYSQDESANDGGDVGWITTGGLPPELAQVIDNLPPGQISDPLATPSGVALLRVDNRRQQVLTADQQRQLARNVLRQRKAQDAFDTWAREARGRAWIEYRDPPK